MGKLQLTEKNLGRVFNSRSGCMCVMHLNCYEAKWPDLRLKTRPKQLVGYLPLAFALSSIIILPQLTEQGDQSLHDVTAQ